MPFTPFHFGPGLLLKSLLARWFSFPVFVLSQIVIDVETLSRIVSGAPALHGPAHSLFGATIAAGVTILMTRLLYGAASGVHQWFEVVRRQQPAYPAPPFAVVCVTACIGAWSHVLLDSVMHRDVQPFHPFSPDNPWLDLVSLSALHQGCVLAGVLGGLIWLGRWLAGKF